MTNEVKVLEQGPFSGIDLSKMDQSDAQIIRNANEDFLLVLDGKKPQHAKVNEEEPVLENGSTTSYIGKRYEIVTVQSPSKFGGLDGYVYGPVITFRRSFAPGNMTTVNYLRFYTTEQMKQMMA